MEDLTGKVAVITGGASGIGLATARVLAREGMKLVLADIEEDPLNAAVEEFRAAGTEVIGVETDVANHASVGALADRTFDEFGAAHVVFNNAGIAVTGPTQDMSHADWEWSINVNLWGPIHGVEAFAQRMVAQDEGGHIINTASFAGLVANKGLGAYCVTKYGVVALSECLQKDLKPHGIGVSVLCPMIVRTNIRQSARNRPAELGGEDEQAPVWSKEEEETLVGGTIEAPEVAERVLRAIRNNELYIITHDASREFVRRRFDRIDKSFDG
jgi:NAD(P)-dependent dehydrogenase (short-subunit alcohol dehydrogenase family)